MSGGAFNYRTRVQVERIVKAGYVAVVSWHLNSGRDVVRALGGEGADEEVFPLTPAKAKTFAAYLDSQEDVEKGWLNPGNGYRAIVFHGDYMTLVDLDACGIAKERGKFVAREALS